VCGLICHVFGLCGFNCCGVSCCSYCHCDAHERWIGCSIGLGCHRECDDHDVPVVLVAGW